LRQAIVLVPVVQVELNHVTVFIHLHGRNLITSDDSAALVAKRYAFDAHIDLRSVPPYTDANPHAWAKFSPVARIENESKLGGPTSIRGARMDTDEADGSFQRNRSMALTESTMMLELGTAAPDFELRDVMSEKTVRRDDFRGQRGLLVMFICAHCPYVKHVEKGLASLGEEYAGKPLGMVAISSNDAEMYRDDSPDRLKEQAQRLGFRFPYLYDETQQVARAFKAACTPDFFLFNGDMKLVYRGQFDASRPGNGIPTTGNDLRAAIDAVLAGWPVCGSQQPSIGCNIKWK
jgi:peroxiredoxin